MKGSRGLLFLCLLAIPIVTIGGALQVAIAFYCPNVCGEVSLELVPASLLLGLGSSVVVSLMGIRRLMGTSGNANVNEDDVHG